MLGIVCFYVIALWCLCRGQGKPRFRIKCTVQATLSCTVHAPGDAYSCAYGLLLYVRGSLEKMLGRGQMTATTTHTPYLIQEALRSFALKLWWNRLVWKRKVQLVDVVTLEVNVFAGVLQKETVLSNSLRSVPSLEDCIASTGGSCWPQRSSPAAN